VAMVEHARKIHWEGETDDTPTHKRKREEEEKDSDHSPTFKCEMKCVDENMRRASPRVSQRMETRAQAAPLGIQTSKLERTCGSRNRGESPAAMMEISDSE
jgi:hypothetical protein